MTGGDDATTVLLVLAGCAAVILGVWVFTRIDPSPPAWYLRLQGWLRAYPAWLYLLVAYGGLLAGLYAPAGVGRGGPGGVAAGVVFFALLVALVIRGHERAMIYGILIATNLGIEALPFDRDFERLLFGALAVGLVAWLCDDDDEERPEPQTA